MDSLYCNRCGAKVQDAAAEHRAGNRAAHLAVPPPRPARRAPTLPPVYDPEPEDEIEEQYIDDYQDDVADDGEDVIFRITPAFYEVGLAYFVAGALSLLVMAIVAYTRIHPLIAVVFAVVFFVSPIFRHIKHNHTIYTLTSVKLEIKSGVFSTSARNVPLRHIEDVTVKETFKERLIGIGDIQIDSAAMEDKIEMSNIKNPREYADLILDHLPHGN